MILDLPPELIRPIFQHVTDLSNLRDALKLRQVCSEFSLDLPLFCPFVHLRREEEHHASNAPATQASSTMR